MTDKETIAAQKVEIANLKREIYWLGFVLKNISNQVEVALEKSVYFTFEDTKEG